MKKFVESINNFLGNVWNSKRLNSCSHLYTWFLLALRNISGFETPVNVFSFLCFKDFFPIYIIFGKYTNYYVSIN